ncbi:NUDIX hydrolase [Streptomyces sp. NPDC049954]|uniref:NUDIX hydrolase n=1 Tax=Streptomyces sp. NPDC049954 TaxID=3155779 RepID=UPI00341F46EA
MSDQTEAIAVRACAAILNRGSLCLIRRGRLDGDQYSLPGGLVCPEESVAQALARELKEELHLDIDTLDGPPTLLWVQDQQNTRPDHEGAFRRLHLIHRLSIPDGTRRSLPAVEQDADDANAVMWVPLRRAAELHLYPAVGPYLGAIDELPSEPNVMLPPMNDEKFAWR